VTSVPSASQDAGIVSRLILASASPRRQSLLREAGYEFEVHPADLNEESFGQGLLPGDLAYKLAIAKAESVGAKFPNEVILAADTVVAFGDQPLGKPADAQAAKKMLSLLEGTTHILITGVAVFRQADGMFKSSRVLSAVRMNSLTQKQIDEYVAGNQWQGKAGGYGIQDPDPFVSRITGCHTNIVGLPMKTTAKLLDLFGIYPTL